MHRKVARLLSCQHSAFQLILAKSRHPFAHFCVLQKESVAVSDWPSHYGFMVIMQPVRSLNPICLQSHYWWMIAKWLPSYTEACFRLWLWCLFRLLVYTVNMHMHATCQAFWCLYFCSVWKLSLSLQTHTQIASHGGRQTHEMQTSTIIAMLQIQW